MKEKKEKKPSAVAVLLGYAGRPAELLCDEKSLFRRMAQLQSASALWSI